MIIYLQIYYYGKMNYSKIKYHDTPIIRLIGNKEFQIRKSLDNSIYQIVKYNLDPIHNSKTLCTIEYVSNDNYNKLSTVSKTNIKCYISH
jgi:hypothetical protein